MIQPGDSLPEGKLIEKAGAVQNPVNPAQDYADKTVVLFAVPGAFTPTCSAKHLPGFVDQAQQLKDKGVDIIACMSVNDAFVMDAWGESQGASGKVSMLADGNGDYAKALGMDMDASDWGMGLRSQRFALIARNGKVSHVMTEKPGEFGNTAVESVLKALS